jgi:sugar/nucleoside kinase (ribokinase family)
MLGSADFQQAGHCRLFDFNEGSIRDSALRPLVFQAVLDARNAGSAVLYAVNLRKKSWHEGDDEIRRIELQAIQQANIVVLNEDELRFLCGEDCQRGARFLQSFGPRIVVITRGGDGDISLHVGAEMAAIPPYHVPVIYDIGAGDTFHAGLAAAALCHSPSTMSFSDWSDAVRFAAATAALRVSTSADPHDLPTFTEVQAWMKAR